MLTDLEFAELRYGGKPAAALRGFRAIYLALPINLIIMGWVTRAMVTVLQISLNINPWKAAILLFAITAGYTIFSGLWGVVVTDTFQFVVKMGGVIALAFFAVRSIGGLDELTRLSTAHFGSRDAAFGVLPPVDKAWLPLSTLLVFLCVQWWAAWYPGAEPGGGGYVAQRILAAKDERHGLLATLWFKIAHYALRPWPWILVGFVALIRYPGLANPEEGYVRVMVDVLPSPIKGLLLATFAAAYMSTIGTHLNWGASYLVNDVYLRFINATRAAAQVIRVALGHRRTHGLFAYRHELSQQRRAGLEAAHRARRRHRAGLHPAVVLVAGQRLVGDQRDGRLVHHLHRPFHFAHMIVGDTVPPGVRETMLITVVDHGRLAQRDVRYPAGGRCGAGALLPEGQAGRNRMAPGVGTAGVRLRYDSRGLAGMGELDRGGGGGLLRRWYPLGGDPHRIAPPGGCSTAWWR